METLDKSFSALQRAEIAEISTASSSDAPPPTVSVLFNEPKLLKFIPRLGAVVKRESFSALQRAEIAEIHATPRCRRRARAVSVLFNEPKLLKFVLVASTADWAMVVSVLFNEPKLLK